jgi:hypothetical protein
MLSFRRRIFLLGIALASVAAGVTCEKVPLLAPTGSTITLTATATALSANGTTPITAQVIEAAGTPPHSGTHITFVTTLGRLQPAEAETDVNGQVSSIFMAGGSNGTATITALSGGASTGTTGSLKILVGTAAVGSVAVTANPNPVPALGGSTTVTARVLDVNGNPLVASPVSFTTTAGTLSTNVVPTDSNGGAAAVLTTSTQATVTASVGAQGTSSTPTPPATGGTTTTPTSTGQASGTVTVNVAGAPTLIITVPTTPPSAGVPASFTFAVTAATANASPIRSVTVNWGDGSPVQDLGAFTGSNTVAHTYRSAGSYAINATVVDSFGTTVPFSTSVVVNPRPQPAVTLTGPTATPTAGTDTVFTGSVAPAANSGAVIQDVVMDYGDGTTQPLGAITGTSIALHHVYLTAGTYTATLTATDSNGGVGKSATSVFVQTATPLAVALTSSQVSSGGNTTVSFTATVIGLGNAVVVNYHWVFGGSNGTADTSNNQQSRTYPIGSGPITVSVTITTSDGRTATGSTVITP